MRLFKSRIKKLKIITQTVIVLLLILAPLRLFAATVEELAITLPKLSDIVNSIAYFLIVSGGVIALIFIIWGGITYMAAGSNTTKVDEAKKRIRNGVIGAAVVLGVGVIIATIVSLLDQSFFTGNSQGIQVICGNGNCDTGERCQIGQGPFCCPSDCP